MPIFIITNTIYINARWIVYRFNQRGIKVKVNFSKTYIIYNLFMRFLDPFVV